MIQPNELRVGNYVTDDFFDIFKNIIKVDSINNKGINLEIEDDGKWAEIAQRWIGCEYSFESLFGIPLTEEILIKCGFKKSNDLDEFYHLDLLNKWTRIYFNPKHNICILQINQDDSCIKIQYLHQLQNLVFSLTQKELTIQL